MKILILFVDYVGGGDKMKVINCFPFFDELDLLKVRLHELDPWVDRFVLVESRETYSGNKKPLYFAENKEMFKEFLPKITPLEFIPPKGTGMPKNAAECDIMRENPQRAYMMEGLRDCSDDDIILIGDLDEIPRGMDFEEVFKRKPFATHKVFLHAAYFYYMNLYRPGAWTGTIILPYKNLVSVFNSSPQTVMHGRRKHTVNITKGVKDRGWHFTFMGGVEAVQYKEKSYGHFDRHINETVETTRNRMKEGYTFRGRSLIKVPIDDTYPKWFVENIKDFKHLLLE